MSGQDTTETIGLVLNTNNVRKSPSIYLVLLYFYYQYLKLQDLLVDQSVLVRVTVVTGVCHILSLYFDLVHFPMMKEILGKLVKELAWDAATIDVRVAVVQVRKT